MGRNAKNIRNQELEELSGSLAQQALSSDLARRIRRNPKFSLRAYAKVLGIDPSLLSKIISGKRTCSAKMLRYLSEKNFIPLFWTTTSPRSKASPLALDHGKTFNDERRREIIIEMERIQLLSDWVHFAILELLSHPNLPKSPHQQQKWLCSSLKTEGARVADATKRLIKLGLATQSTGQGLKPAKSNISTTTIGNPNLTSEAHREHQRAVLEEASKALESVPFENRDHSAVIFTFSHSNMTLAKTALQRIRREFMATMEVAPAVGSDVYCASFAFFPLSQT